MPDTKTGREKKGKNKRAQLREHLAEQEIESLDGDADEEPPLYDADEELPLYAADEEEDLLADELPDDE